MSHRRARVVFVAVLSLMAAAAFGQSTCPTPVIIQIAGTNPSCGVQSITLDAGSGWATYQWSNGATTRTISDSPSTTTSYTVTATDANGCSATSVPYQVTVVPAPDTPAIHLAEEGVCPGGYGTASVDPPPNGSWTTFGWMLEHATINGSSALSSVSFNADASGQPVHLTVTVTDANGCTATATATLPIRTIVAPVLHVYPDTICAGSFGTATIDPPDPNNPYATWSSVQWSISNGTVASNFGSSIEFYTDPAGGPATITVTATDNSGCANSATATTIVRTIPPPVLHSFPDTICAGSFGTALIDSPDPNNPYATWSNVRWTLTNGTITSDRGTSVEFTTDPGGAPVTISVTATDSYGCTNSATATTIVRTIPPPVLRSFPDTICAGSFGTATIDPPDPNNPYATWSNVRWTLTNGTITSDRGTSVEFTTDPGGAPVTISVTATDSLGCTNSATATTIVRTIPPPVLHVFPDSICAGSFGSASIDPPDPNFPYYGWSNVHWAITNGTIAYDRGSSIDFNTNSAGGPVTITVTATDNLGCTNSATATTVVRTIPPPVLHVYPDTICAGSFGSASIDPPDPNFPYYGWSNVHWAITNGTIAYDRGSAIDFNTNPAGGPVTITVTATDNLGCTNSATATTVVRTIGPPVLHAYPDAICAGAFGSAFIDPPDPNNPYFGWRDVHWTVTNGTITNDRGTSVDFTTNSAGGAATIVVTATDYNGCTSSATATTVVRTLAPPVIHSTSNAVCAGTPAGASIDPPDPNNPYYGWRDVQWSATNATITLRSGNSVDFVADSSGQPVTVTVTVSDYSYCSATNSLTIPVLTVTPPTIQPEMSTICVNGYDAATVDSPPDNPWTYIYWTIENGTIQYGQGTTRVNFQADGTGNPVVLHVGVNNSSFCYLQSSVTIPTHTNAPPAIQLASGSCPTSATVTNAGDFYSFNWSGDNVEIIDGWNSPTINFRPRGNGHVMLTVRVYDASGCDLTSSIGYDVSGLADLSVTFTDTSWCTNTPITASVPNGGPGFTYQWTTSSYGIRFTSATNSPSVTFMATDEVGNITVTATNADGCSDQATVAMWIPSAPNLTFTTLPTGVCANGTATIGTYPVVRYTYVWQVIDGDIVSGAGTNQITFRPHAGVEAVTIRLTMTEYNCSRTIEQIVPVTAPASITPSGPTALCPGASVTLTASSGSSWSWSTGANTRSITVSQPGTYSVTITGGGCQVSTAINVTAAPAPTAAITASGPTTFCAGGSVMLTASNGASYLWSTGATTQSISVNSSGNYTVTVTNANGCSATSTPTAVTVNAAPPTPAVAHSGLLTFCDGGSVTLTAPAGYSSYLWSTGATTQAITVSDSAQVSVTVTDANGCSAQSTVIFVNEYPPVMAEVFADRTTACAGQSANLSINGDTGTIRWSTGATTSSIVVTQSGDYSYSVTNIHGCSATSAPLHVSIDPAPVTPQFVSSPTTACPSALDMIVTVTNFSSFTSLNYRSNRTITSSANGVLHISRPFNSGGFWVEADGTTANGCIYTGRIDVPEGTGPDTTITAPATVCGGTTQQATAADAGLGATYQWNAVSGIWSLSNATSRTATFIANPSATSATLECWITDATGACTNKGTVTINVIPAPSANITVTPSTVCDSGSYTATVPDAGAGATYQWTYGGNLTVNSIDGRTLSFTTTGAGSINLGMTVTAGTGCSNQNQGSITLQIGSPLTVSPSGPTAICQGSSVTLTASSNMLSYHWSTGETTRSITVSQAGTYSVTGVSGNGCTSRSADTTVTVLPLPDATITASGPTTFCAGGNVTLTSPAGSGYSYQWSNGATTRSITVGVSGNFWVSVRDQAGCYNSSTVTVTVSPLPSATITASGPTTFCAGGSVTLTASSGGSSYLWSTGATTQAITVNSSGNYSVTVTDANGCSATSTPRSVTVNPLPSVSVTASGPTTFCAGGAVTLSATGSTGSYLWSTGARTQSITVSTSGSYSVNLIDANGCSVNSAPTTVTVNALPTATITASGPTTFCAGGSVTLTASSGASYAWSNGATTQSITVNSSGNYSVTVTDANGCSATSSATAVTVNALPSATITASGPTTFCAGGSVTLTASSGASYAWSNGATTQSITVSASGNYSVTVTGANGCSATSSATAVTVNALPSATITASGPTTFCAGGSVTLTASSSVSYAWSNGATTQSITVNSPGNYSVTVTDANGCSATSSATAVTVNPLPSAAITPSGSTTFCAGGSVILTGSDGASWLWSNGATTQSITVNSSGSYSVTVTGTNGCSATSSATAVTVNALPSATITPSGPTTFCAGGSVTLTASSGASYAWSNGATTQSITVNSSGNYSVTVTGANGCSATSAATTVTANALPSAAITPSGPTTFCAGGSVTLTAPSSASYAWSNGATTQSITVNSAGDYSVTVTDANGCSGSSGVTTVVVNPLPVIVSFDSGNNVCQGVEAATEIQPMEGVTYAWAFSGSGHITQNAGHRCYFIVDSGTATLTVTVTDANGCSASLTKTFTAFPPVTPTITASGNTTFCAGGSVTLTSSAGYRYTWSNGATTQAIAVSQPGDYTVTVLDLNGCTAQSAATHVVVNTPVKPSITGATSFCPGGSTTLTATVGSSYLWSPNNQTTQSITVGSGTYHVTVVDANGCSATSDDVQVVVNTPVQATITPSGSTTFCTGGSVTLAANAGSSYLWSNNQTTQSINVNSSGDFYVTVTDSNGCTSRSATTHVTVNTRPTAAVSGGATFCAGGSANITATLTGAPPFAITWSDGAQQNVSGTSTTRTVSPSSTTTYTITSITDATTCAGTSSGSATITVNTKPAFAQPSDQTIARNTSATLTVNPTGTAPFTYQWFKGSYPSTTNRVATTQTYITPKLGHGTYTYWVRVTDTCGSTDSATITISVP
jgi:hypothetical protein